MSPFSGPPPLLAKGIWAEIGGDWVGHEVSKCSKGLGERNRGSVRALRAPGGRRHGAHRTGVVVLHECLGQFQLPQMNEFAGRTVKMGLTALR